MWAGSPDHVDQTRKCLGNDDTSEKFMGHRVCRKRGEGQEETPRGEEERSGQGGMLIAIIKYI